MEEHLEEHPRVQGGSIKGGSNGRHGARGGAIRVKATQLEVGGISGRCEGGLLQGSSGLGVETLTREVGGMLRNGSVLTRRTSIEGAAAHLVPQRVPEQVEVQL